jgi:hypothetical protein
MQNVLIVSRPVFHVLSNGALGFGVSPILCTGKWRKHFTETDLAFNLRFQHIRLPYTYRKPKCTIRKSVKFPRISKTLRFSMYFVFVHDFCAWCIYKQTLAVIIRLQAAVNKSKPRMRKYFGIKCVFFYSSTSSLSVTATDADADGDKGADMMM